MSKFGINTKYLEVFKRTILKNVTRIFLTNIYKQLKSLKGFEYWSFESKYLAF